MVCCTENIIFTTTYTPTDYAPDRSVRLIGGSDPREGIVEIAYDGRWGMLCTEDFTTFDSRAICEDLGYDRDDASIVPSRYEGELLFCAYL